MTDDKIKELIPDVDRESIPYGYQGCDIRDVQQQTEYLRKAVEALISLTIDGINDKYDEIHPRYTRYRTDEWILNHAEDFFREEMALIEQITGKRYEEIGG